MFPHATRRWAKKIRGKLHYFGPWDDPDAALAKYLDQKDDLHAGRTPRVAGDGLTLRDLVNRFLSSKERAVATGDLQQRSFTDYYQTCRRLIEVFGTARLVTNLAADDFERLNALLAENMAPVTRKVEIQRIRSVFKWGFDSGVIDQPVRYGPGFKPPGKQILQKARLQNREKMYEADEIRAILEAASVPLSAMILLGINCGFGNNDCATLPKTALDLDGGWVDHPRPKTGAVRRCPLWPETVAALREAIDQRPEPKAPADDRLVFVTPQGHPYVRHKGHVSHNAVGLTLYRLLHKIGLWKRGRGFYTLRHVCETIGGESIDQVAVDHVMGHQRQDMASVYRERISDERLQNVTNHVHGWLFGSEGTE